MQLLAFFGVYLVVDCFFGLSNTPMPKNPRGAPYAMCSPEDADIYDILCLCVFVEGGNIRQCDSLTKSVGLCLLDDGNTTVSPPTNEFDVPPTADPQWTDDDDDDDDNFRFDISKNSTLSTSSLLSVLTRDISQEPPFNTSSSTLPEIESIDETERASSSTRPAAEVKNHKLDSNRVLNSRQTNFPKPTPFLCLAG